MNGNNISSLFEVWNNALQTGDPNKVAELYEPNAILLPTVSNKVRHNHEEIADYFVHFLAKGPEGKVCLLYTSPSPRDQRGSRMPSSA